MRKFALLSASALVLALGVASASAQPSTDQLLKAGLAGPAQDRIASATVYEGRSAAVEAPSANAFIYQQHIGR